MRYGLIGEKLGHSYSKIIHEKLADYTYDLIPLSREEFGLFMEKMDFTAINVTIPYKQGVIPYLDELHPLAQEIGAVNTIVNKNGHSVGYNTDFYGFEYMLKHNDIQIKGKKCLILGAGGSSLTVQAVLRHLSAGEIYVVSRKVDEKSINYNCVNYKENFCEKNSEVRTCKVISYETCYASIFGYIPSGVVFTITSASV
jgi:shikimate dehydrogenase